MKNRSFKPVSLIAIIAMLVMAVVPALAAPVQQAEADIVDCRRPLIPWPNCWAKPVWLN
jgi:hypothetical protein